jgi:hypothetical protein
MRSLLFLLLFVFGFFASSAFASIVCSTANGEATYLENHYNGGAPPPPGSEIGRTEWKLSGVVLLRSLTCTPSSDVSPEFASCSADGEIQDADLTAHFLLNSERTLYESPSNEPWHHVRKYVSVIELVRPSGKPLPTGVARYEDFVICTESWILAP